MKPPKGGRQVVGAGGFGDGIEAMTDDAGRERIETRVFGAVGGAGAAEIAATKFGCGLHPHLVGARRRQHCPIILDAEAACHFLVGAGAHLARLLQLQALNSPLTMCPL